MTISIDYANIQKMSCVVHFKMYVTGETESLTEKCLEDLKATKRGNCVYRVCCWMMTLCRARTEAQSLVTNVTGLVDQRCSQLVTEGGRLCSQVMANG